MSDTLFDHKSPIHEVPGPAGGDNDKQQRNGHGKFTDLFSLGADSVKIYIFSLWASNLMFGKFGKFK